MLNKDSFRTGTSDTPLFDCGKVDESVEHFLLHCENYTEARKVTLDTVEDLFSTSKYRHSLRITEDLLLAPTYLWPKFFGKIPRGKIKPKYVFGYDR